jgi:hypothetical protein
MLPVASTPAPVARRLRTLRAPSSAAVPGFSMLYVPAEPQQISQAPTKLSSISAAPESSSRPGSTIARRCLCSHAHAFW